MSGALRIVLGAVLAAVVLLGGSPASAQGAWGWPSAGERRVLLPYGATYETGGVTRTHHGMDVAVEGEVLAVCGGEVSWTGELPSEGGGRAPAVTVLSSDGMKVTYWPLEGVRVRAGQAVEAGEVVADGATEGDPSSPGRHLHVSVRRGETYLDPASFIAAAPPVVAAGSSPPPAPEPSPAPGPAPLSGPAVPVTPAPVVAQRGAAPVRPRPTAPRTIATRAFGTVSEGGAPADRRVPVIDRRNASPLRTDSITESTARRASSADRSSSRPIVVSARTSAGIGVVPRRHRTAPVASGPTLVSAWRRVRDAWGGLGRLLVIPLAAFMSLACCAVVIRRGGRPDLSAPSVVAERA